MEETLHTARLYLRPWRLGDDNDLSDFHSIWGDTRVIFWGECESLEMSAEFLERVHQRGAGADKPWPIRWFRVALKDNDQCVGNVILQECRHFPNCVEIGWHTAFDQWGKGYGTEASKALLECSIEQLPDRDLIALILPDNERSQGVARRLGMVVKDQVIHADLPHDVWHQQGK